MLNYNLQAKIVSQVYPREEIISTDELTWYNDYALELLENGIDSK